MKKAGAVMARKLSDWFDPFNPEHVLGYHVRRLTGQWPIGFLPDTVYEDADWETLARQCVNPRILNGLTDTVIEFERILYVVKDVRFPGYTFEVGVVKDLYYIRVRYMEPDVDDPNIPVEQVGRIWAFPANQTEDQIVNTCFKAIMTSMEHKTREHFTYQGVRVMYPHRTMSEVVEMMRGHNG